MTLPGGASWPTVSVILHLLNLDQYPILDFRAIWSVPLDVPDQYGFDYWQRYVEFCRGLASAMDVDRRTLDQALRKYSKENQEPGMWGVLQAPDGVLNPVRGACYDLVTSRYQARWCCLAQARVTVPYHMARIVPLVQMAA